MRTAPDRFALVVAGLMAVGVACILPQLRAIHVPALLRDKVLIAPVLLLLAVGFAKGATAHFWVSRSPQETDFLAAQIWARSHTPRNTMFLPMGSVKEGFSLFSRRPVWWEEPQGGVVVWAPSFYPIWSCREHAVSSVSGPRGLAALALNANVDYLVIEKGSVGIPATEFSPVYSGAYYQILRRGPSKVRTPICPETTASKT